MKALVALLLLSGSAIAQDGFDWRVTDSVPWVVTDRGGGDLDLPVQDAQAQGTDALSSFVHRLLVNGTHGGSCVCIAPGAYVTAEHIFSGLRLQSLAIDGVQLAATVQPAPGDLMLIRANSGHSPAQVTTDRLAAGARVHLFGMTTGAVQDGTIVEVGDDAVCVSVDQDDTGTTQGDSGGGVFDASGRLVGVISAYYGSKAAGNENKRRVYFAPLSAAADLVASFSPAAAPPAAPGADTKPALTIHVAPFHCPPCNALKRYDWSDFRVTWRTGGASAYPEISWMDAKGKRRFLRGDYRPDRVMWSWKATMD